MHRIAIFASGSGSNARNILQYFRNNPSYQISLIVTNRNTAGVIAHANEFEVPVVYAPASQFKDCPEHILSKLLEYRIDFIVLAGFLLKMPDLVVAAFKGRMVNIHPSLLPAFGGPGMYGDKVHEAVIESKSSESGITIHHVNEHYDEGEVIFQAKTPVFNSDNAVSLRVKVQQLEQKWFPVIIEQVLKKTFSKDADPDIH
jgi:phosphoribosylglycinamide formyltransferase-1